MIAIKRSSRGACGGARVEGGELLSLGLQLSSLYLSLPVPGHYPQRFKQQPFECLSHEQQDISNILGDSSDFNFLLLLNSASGWHFHLLQVLGSLTHPQSSSPKSGFALELPNNVTVMLPFAC